MSTVLEPARVAETRSGGRQLPRLPLRARRTVLVLHVIASVGWLGLNLGNLLLTVTGYTTGNATTQHAAYLVLGLVGDTYLIPVSLTAWASGLVLSVGTHWGLRHGWIIAKLVLTSVAVVLIPLSLLPGIHDLVTLVSATAPDQLADPGRNGVSLVVAACVSTSMYTTCVVLSVFKPRRRRRANR